MRLLLRIVVERQTEGGAGSLVWVLPVPAPAAQVKAELLREWPTIEGTDVPAAVTERAQSILLWSTATQLWPLVFAPALSPRHAIPSVRQPLVAARSLHDGIRIDTLSARIGGRLGLPGALGNGDGHAFCREIAQHSGAYVFAGTTHQQGDIWLPFGRIDDFEGRVSSLNLTKTWSTGLTPGTALIGIPAANAGLRLTLTPSLHYGDQLLPPPDSKQ